MKIIDEARVLKLFPGDVHGYGKTGKPPPLPLRHIAAHLVVDQKIQPGDIAHRLHERDKFPWHNLFPRAPHSGQRLRSRNLPRPDIKKRLQNKIKSII